jgi:predicted RNA-binding Zn ribbon-like protein
MDAIDTLTTESLQEMLDRSELDRPPPAGVDDLKAIRGLRSRVREVFESGSVEAAVDNVNRILKAAEAIPFVGMHDQGPHMHVAPRRSDPAGWLGATIGMGLAELVIHYGTDRFGVCSADDCRDVFIDTSRNHSRKHCSDRCTNREGVRSFRRRREG